MEDIRAAAGLAVVDQVFPCGEALHIGGNVACGLHRVRMLSEQPKALGDSVNHSVCVCSQPARPNILIREASLGIHRNRVLPSTALRISLNAATSALLMALLRGTAQCTRRNGSFATRISFRKALLTDRSSGKYSATSGERSTRLVPAL